MPRGFRMDSAPTPDLSRMAGEPKAPAERTTSLEANALTGSESGAESLTYSIPIARFPLEY